MCVLVVGLSVNGTANAQRIACDNFAELAVSVVQIRQKESQIQRVLDYAEKNLKGEYHSHIFLLVKDMILAAYERPTVGNSGVQAEAVNFAGQQREICNKRYSELEASKID
jgi:hypothetical protein